MVLPVGVNPNALIIAGSMHVQLAPESIIAVMRCICGIGCPAAVSASARACVTLRAAIISGAEFVNCRVKCGIYRARTFKALGTEPPSAR